MFYGLVLFVQVSFLKSCEQPPSALSVPERRKSKRVENRTRRNENPRGTGVARVQPKAGGRSSQRESTRAEEDRPGVSPSRRKEELRRGTSTIISECSKPSRTEKAEKQMEIVGVCRGEQSACVAPTLCGGIRQARSGARDHQGQARGGGVGRTPRRTARKKRWAKTPADSRQGNHWPPLCGGWASPWLFLWNFLAWISRTLPLLFYLCCTPTLLILSQVPPYEA